MALSNAQVDALGERLRAGSPLPDDLQVLDAYRRSFHASFEVVMAALQAVAGVVPTGRPAKTTESIIAKLQRGNLRLSRMQDVAGCRLIVPDIKAQDALAATTLKLFAKARVVDRRIIPSHGYRAVHVIVTMASRSVEVQIRTRMQHDWAQFSEKLPTTWVRRSSTEVGARMSEPGYWRSHKSLRRKRLRPHCPGRIS